MALPFFNWSRTAANNATADSTVNWAEGQAPSTVNDSARAMMASTAAFRDDISGAIVTGGTNVAYTVTSYQVFDTLAHLNGQMVAFVPNATSGGTCTLNVDGLGAKPLRFAPSVELPVGTLIAGTPYIATYNNSDGAFYLQGFTGNNPYYLPIAGGCDYWGPSVPNSNFAFPIGQAISRTTYANLFALIGTTFGVGDGSTTFNLPDKTGRVSAMKEASATRLTSTYFGGNSANLGATGGLESETLTLAQLPTGITVTGTVTVTSTVSDVARTLANLAPGGSGVQAPSTSGAITSTGSNTMTSNNTSGNPHNICQPTIVCNYIIRVA